jgi:hypothetical protein
MELCGGDLDRISQLESKKRDDLRFELIDEDYDDLEDEEVDELDELYRLDDEDDEY